MVIVNQFVQPRQRHTDDFQRLGFVAFQDGRIQIARHKGIHRAEHVAGIDIKHPQGFQPPRAQADFFLQFAQSRLLGRFPRVNQTFDAAQFIPLRPDRIFAHHQQVVALKRHHHHRRAARRREPFVSAVLAVGKLQIHRLNLEHFGLRGNAHVQNLRFGFIGR